MFIASPKKPEYKFYLEYMPHKFGDLEPNWEWIPNSGVKSFKQACLNAQIEADAMGCEVRVVPITK